MASLLRKNLISNYIGQFLVVLINIASVPFFFNYLGVESYGLIGFYSTLQVWLSMLDFGIGPTVGRQSSLSLGNKNGGVEILNLIRTSEVLMLVIGFILFLSMFLVSEWISNDWLIPDSLSKEDVRAAIVIMSAIIAIKLFENIYKSSLLGFQRQELFNLLNVALTILRSGGAILVLKYFSSTIQTFFYWQLFASFLGALILKRVVYTTLPKSGLQPRFSIDKLKEIGRYSAGIMTITISSAMLTQSDKLILSKNLNLSEFGLYTLASIMASLVLVAGAPIAQAWFPKLCQQYALRSRKAFIENYHLGSQLVSIIVGSSAIIMIIFSEQVLYIWTGDKVLASHLSELVSVLALGNLLNGLMSMPYQAQLAYGWTRLSVSTNIVSLLIIIPLLYFLVPSFGAISAAWIWVSLNGFYLIFVINKVHKKIMIKEKSLWYINDVFLPIMLGFGVGYLLKYIVSPFPQHRIYQLIIILIIGLLVMISATLMTKFPKKILNNLN